MKLFAQIKNKTFKILDEKILKDWAYWQNDGFYEVRIEKSFKKRTLNQNRYYFGVLVKNISDHTGYETEEIHEVLKDRFLPKKFIVITNNKGEKKETKINGSTTQLDTKEFEEYNEKIRRWAAQHLSIYLPEPNEY